jgi:16S rRNA (guanine527-N7)-methyltransferase
VGIVPVENLEALVREGLEALRPAVLGEELPGQLARYAAELLKWNERVNLTAITEPREVVEKHLLDSLAVLPEVDETAPVRVLDLGAGAGLPGVVWALARPRLEVTLVDAVAKKVAFLNATSARLGLAPRVRALHARLTGNPGREGVPTAPLVVSRAFMDLEAWLGLARAYVAPGGVVVGMTGRHLEPGALDRIGVEQGFRCCSRRSFRLPWSGDERGVSVWQAAVPRGTPANG